MAIRNPHLAIITLNVNGLNSPKKRHKVADLIKQQNAIICCLKQTHQTAKRQSQTQNKWVENYSLNRYNPQEAGVAILISEK